MSKDFQKIFQDTRQKTLDICAPLAIEDYGVQPSAEVSPPKWHLGHTTWFFETMVLVPFLQNYQLFHEKFSLVFNSYYQSLGDKISRDTRSNASRPTVHEVCEYRQFVDSKVIALMDQLISSHNPLEQEILARIELGVNHEQQHQELLYMDILNIFAMNPLQPVYQEFCEIKEYKAPAQSWQTLAGGIYEIGHTGDGFSYDNESPVHKVFLNDFQIANRLVTNVEYLEFMRDGGYEDFRLWLDDGWTWVQTEGISSPLYWQKAHSEYWQMELSGLGELQPHDPVKHISFYEAAAYARWRGMRLAREEEWEVAASFAALADRNQLWEWTASPYIAYPGFKPLAGPLGEYNGKFMANQMVLRGGSFATSKGHTRTTYRNFFYPQQRWMFSGIRLASNA